MQVAASALSAFSTLSAPRPHAPIKPVVATLPAAPGTDQVTLSDAARAILTKPEASNFPQPVNDTALPKPIIGGGPARLAPEIEPDIYVDEAVKPAGAAHLPASIVSHGPEPIRGRPVDRPIILTPPRGESPTAPTTTPSQPNHASGNVSLQDVVLPSKFSTLARKAALAYRAHEPQTAGVSFAASNQQAVLLKSLLG